MSISCFVTSTVFVCGSNHGSLARVHLSQGALVLQPKVHSQEITSLDIIRNDTSHHRPMICSTSRDGFVRLLDLESLVVVHSASHWHGIRGQECPLPFVQASSMASIPQSLRQFYGPNGIHRLYRCFEQHETTQRRLDEGHEQHGLSLGQFKALVMEVFQPQDLVKVNAFLQQVHKIRLDDVDAVILNSPHGCRSNIN